MVNSFLSTNDYSFPFCLPPKERGRNKEWSGKTGLERSFSFVFVFVEY
jgi:hypothetical protein